MCIAVIPRLKTVYHRPYTNSVIRKAHSDESRNYILPGHKKLAIGYLELSPSPTSKLATSMCNYNLKGQSHDKSVTTKAS